MDARAQRATPAPGADIRTAIRIVPAAKVNFKRDAEYCILIYSEKKDNYLMNAGYTFPLVTGDYPAFQLYFRRIS